MASMDPGPDEHPTRRICWRVNLRASPDRVYAMLATPAGRARFWARAAEEEGDEIHFVFHGGAQLRAPVVERTPGQRFAVRYFGGSLVAFELVDDGAGGTDLTLIEHDCPAAEYEENLPGWVSVLLQLKAAVDFDIELRNRSPERNWARRFVDV